MANYYNYIKNELVLHKYIQIAKKKQDFHRLLLEKSFQMFHRLGLLNMSGFCSLALLKTRLYEETAVIGTVMSVFHKLGRDHHPHPTDL